MLLMSFPLSQTCFAYVVAESQAVPKQPKQPRVDKEEIIRKLEVYKYLPLMRNAFKNKEF